MAITKDKKKEILAKLAKEVVPAETVVFASFKGVPVLDITAFRKDLRAKEVGYYVAKKTLIRKAFADGGKVAGEMPELVGEVGVAYLAGENKDLIAPAKGVYEFAKKNPEKMQIIGGVFEGKFMNASEMMVVASIPGREVLYGMFVNVINSPIQGLVMVLDGLAKKKGE